MITNCVLQVCIFFISYGFFEWGKREMFTGFLVGIPEGKRHLGRQVHSWEDDIKIDPK
jgi:hypothetical protein